MTPPSAAALSGPLKSLQELLESRDFSNERSHVPSATVCRQLKPQLPNDLRWSANSIDSVYDHHIVVAELVFPTSVGQNVTLGIVTAFKLCVANGKAIAQRPWAGRRAGTRTGGSPGCPRRSALPSRLSSEDEKEADWRARRPAAVEGGVVRSPGECASP